MIGSSRTVKGAVIVAAMSIFADNNDERCPRVHGRSSGHILRRASLSFKIATTADDSSHGDGPIFQSAKVVDFEIARGSQFVQGLR